MPTVARVQTVFTGVAGTPWYSNIYWNGEDDRDVQSIYSVTRAFWAGVRGIITNAVTITVDPQILSYDVESGEAVGADTAEPAAITGGGSATALPYANQALVQASTSAYKYGRNVQGRIYVPGLLQTSAGSILSTAAQGTVTAAAQILLDGPTTDTARWTIYSRPKPFQIGGSLPLDGRPGFESQVTGINVPTKLAVLRSRRD